MLQKYSHIHETLHGKEQPILTQFLSDAASFDASMHPKKIVQFENVISLDTKTNLSDYEIRVWFENPAGQTVLYDFKIPHGADQGNYKLSDL